MICALLTFVFFRISKSERLFLDKNSRYNRMLFSPRRIDLILARGEA